MNSEIKNDIEKKKEEELKRKSSKITKQEMLMLFNPEDEKKDSNIVYNEEGTNKKIKYISLDLLLKKIVIDDFLEKNIFLIYSFSTQCFCFIDSKILFNKIINCYKFFRSQGATAKYLSNIITFFNILVIEMCQYYKEILDDNPCLTIINDFYEIIEKDFFDESPKNENSINLKVSCKENNFESLNNNDNNDNIKIKAINKSCLSYFNGEITDKEKEKEDNLDFNDLYSINENYNINDNSTDNFINDNDVDNYNKKDINNSDNSIIKIDLENNGNKKLRKIFSQNDSNINLKKIKSIEVNKINTENDNLKLNKEIKSESKIRRTVFDEINYKESRSYAFDISFDKDQIEEPNTERENKNIEGRETLINKKDKKESFGFFGFFRKSKEKKMNKSVDAIRKSKRNHNLKKSIKIKKYKTQDEQILSTIKDIKDNLLIQNPNINLIDIIKNSITFYKMINNKLIPEKNNLENIKTRKLKKSNTEDNIFKKKKKIIKSKDYFNVLDWEEKDIANKLMLVSETELKKIQRRELYKAAFLKKNKNKMCPNIIENIDKFNRLSFFIILDILSYDNSKDRAKMIDKWVKIAEYCKKINNFNDLLAINSALNNFIITGLKLTLKEVQKKSFSSLKEINKLCDCQGNYKILRDYMANLKQDEYYLPYLGILLRDLNFYEESSKYIINGKLINLEKIEKIQSILDKFFKFKYIDKNEIDKIPKELNFFDNLENIQEEKLEKIANNIEPIFNYSLKRVKRLTYIDRKYFLNKSKAPPLKD